MNIMEKGNFFKRLWNDENGTVVNRFLRGFAKVLMVLTPIVGVALIIIAISAGMYHTIGLKADGSVVAVGYDYCGQHNVSDWTNVVAISTNLYHTVGIKANGTAVATGNNDYGQCNVSDWDLW